MKQRRGNSRVILISSLATNVVVIVHVLYVLLRVSLGLLTVDKIHSLCLSQFIDLSTSNTDEELLSKLMGDWLSCRRMRLCSGVELREGRRTLFTLSVLEHLEGTERSGAS